MKHPWGRMLDKALRKSKPEDNLVLEKAEELLEKGYRAEEIFEVLLRLEKSLIDDKDAAILKEAVEEFKEHHIEAEDEDEE